MATFPTRLDYFAGNENAPGDPFGRTELSLEPSGAAKLVHKHRGVHRTWTGKVDAATLASLWSALEAGGFPNVPKHPVPGGSAMRVLTALVDDKPVDAFVAWHAAAKLDGYREAFPMLDSIVRQLSEDSVQATPNTLPPVVTDIVRQSAN
jgi:hypothetical protein